MTIGQLIEVLHAQGLTDEAMEKMSFEEFITYLVKHDLGDEGLYEALRTTELILNGEFEGLDLDGNEG